MSAGFAYQVGRDHYHDPEAPLLHNLFVQYEKVIFSSLITAFGLDLFIKDQVGGDVDTIHNVRTGVDYKNKQNAMDYANRVEYNGIDYHSDTRYRQKKGDARRAGDTVEDAYTGGDLLFLGRSKNRPRNLNAECEHVISAKTVHEDRGRVLASLKGVDLANAPENLVFTNEVLNQSLGQYTRKVHNDKTNPYPSIDDSEIPGYIAANPDIPEDQKKRMMDYYNRSKAAYEDKVNTAYYLDISKPSCRRFYSDTLHAAAGKGMQMGVRQVLGFVLTEVWFSIREALRNAGPGIGNKFDAIIDGLTDGYKVAIEKYKDLIGKFGEGLVAGIMSSFTSTLCNIFFTTSKNLGRIIRQSWATIVEATKVLYFNPGSLYFCDRVTDAAKIIAVGASVVIGATAQEAVHTGLISNMPLLPSFLVDIVATFAGELCTGLLSVSLLFIIDNDPFDKYLLKDYNRTIADFKRQAREFNKYCARIRSYDIQDFTRRTRLAHQVAQNLKATDDIYALNRLLTDSAVKLGVACPWGDDDIDAFMVDRENAQFKFKY